MGTSRGPFAVHVCQQSGVLRGGRQVVGLDRKHVENPADERLATCAVRLARELDAGAQLRDRDRSDDEVVVRPDEALE